MGRQSIDLALLQGQKDLDGPVTTEWIERNINVDRTVLFGSSEYYALAADPEIRRFLQSGPNVVFAYQGQVIEVRDAEDQDHQSDGRDTQASVSGSPTLREPDDRAVMPDPKKGPSSSPDNRPMIMPPSFLVSWLLSVTLALLLGLAAVGAIAFYLLWPRLS
jgi:hypothetical protein